MFERNELISFIMLAEKCSFGRLFNKPCNVKGFFDIQEYRSRGHTVIEVWGHVVRKPRALKRRAVT